MAASRAPEGASGGTVAPPSPPPESWLPMLRRLAGTILRRHGVLMAAGRHDLDDLIQAGALAVLRASADYDPERGPFEAWAFVWARGAMLDHIRASLWGGPATVMRRRPRPRTVSSLDAFGHDDPDGRSVDGDEIGAEARVDLGRALRILDERSRWVLGQSFLLGRSVDEIGRDLGVTQSRVSQIRTAAFRKLRTALAVAE